jgi:tetratricopeptide (TPR) repeat protein
MMRHPVTIASTLLLVFSAISASAADKSVWDKCNRTRDTGASIAACTQIVQASGETASDRAIAYSIRGGAYQAEGDSDRAIEDFTKAIEINPQDAKAYVRRGSV